MLGDFLAKRLGFWVLERLGVFWLLKMALIGMVLFLIAKQLFKQNPRVAVFLIVLAACLLEWAEPGHFTYGLPDSFPPTQSVVTFTVDDRTLPGWAEWIRAKIPGQTAGPKVTTKEESNAASNP
ncbi:MAG: hypothetical protein AAF773_26940 [Cyanobacteria bacterium P01_D01_bin.115]